MMRNHMNSTSPAYVLGPRPYCPCCGGGTVSNRYKHGKATRRKYNVKANRDGGKPSRQYKAIRELKRMEIE